MYMIIEVYQVIKDTKQWDEIKDLTSEGIK